MLETTTRSIGQQVFIRRLMEKSKTNNGGSVKRWIVNNGVGRPLTNLEKYHEIF